MKKIIFLTLILAVIFSITLAVNTYAAAQTGKMVMKGTIIDNMCASSHQKDLAAFIKVHPKSCVLMPSCAASGYSLYADGKLYKFDKESNKKIEQFLMKKDSILKVEVNVIHVKNMLHLVSIKNQK